LHSPASMLAYACIRLHRCLHSPASMLAPALHRFCIRLHRTEPTKGEARRLVRFSGRRIESTCETCDGTRGARTRAHPRPSFVPPPSLLVLSSPSRPSSILSRSSIACLVACLAVALVGCATRFLTPVVQWNWRRGKSPSPPEGVD
jgi:hypothetical protein